MTKNCLCQQNTCVDYTQNQEHHFESSSGFVQFFLFHILAPPPISSHRTFAVQRGKSGTYYGAAEGHRRLWAFTVPHRPLPVVALDGHPGTLAPPQRLSTFLASPSCWILGPSSWEGQALVLGPLFTIWVQLLWGLQSLSCKKGVLLLH